MKHEFTFAEVSKIFAQVVKIEEAVKKQQELEAQYKEKGDAFDAEFEKYNFTFFNAPKELHEIFEVKSEAMKQRDNAERKAYRLIKEFVEMIDCSGEWHVDAIKSFLNRRTYWESPKMIDFIKYAALDASRKIRIN